MNFFYYYYKNKIWKKMVLKNAMQIRERKKTLYRR